MTSALRRLVLGLVALLLAFSGVPRADIAAAVQSWARIACSLPKEQIQRVYNGYLEGRSGEVQFLPKYPNFVGSYYSHSGTWPYLQEVPLLFYGPGHVPGTGTVKRPATVADIAATYADMLDFTFDAPDGAPLPEAIDPVASKPKLIFTLVWDGGGRNVLKTYSKSWPNLKRLMRQGAWFENTTVGSSPSVTPSIHASIGTGAFPRHHGIVDLRFRIGGGPPTSTQRAEALISPTLVDEYDVANGNDPVIGMVGAEGTLGVIGHGTGFQGGDADIAAAQRAGKWRLSGSNGQFFHFPGYVPGLSGYKKIRPAADRQDGRIDGSWFGLRLDTPDSLTYTPAYSRYQTGVVDEIIEREGFGADDLTDLLFVNYKVIDKVGHKYSFPSRQMSAVVRGVDQALGDLVKILNRNVGQGQWVLALTADHGFTPKEGTTGASIIDNYELARDLHSVFGAAIQSPRPTQTWVSESALQGHSLGDIARYLMNYTRAQNAANPSRVPPGAGGERLFAAAFPSSILPGLPCIDPGD
ncbi:MAG: alkaline phosphatase family protein [Actinomycetota bacterium]